MNIYRYLCEDGKVYPATGGFHSDVVPPHHIKMIEELCQRQGEHYETSNELWNVISRMGRAYALHKDLIEPLHEKMSNRLDAVCFYIQEGSDHDKARSGFYNIIE